ncbi:MAG TPA: hypothetical protein VEC37_03085, partial [Bacillota bacterium]|nr:hypothetical protein [Bacillota bacterium]
MSTNQKLQYGQTLLNSTLIFALSELRRNLISFSLPLLPYGSLLIYSLITSHNQLNLYGTWAILTFAALFAMTYGLQCFSNESDKKTLDFILTRPLSPYLIISVKYIISLLILTGWILVFSITTNIDLHRLPLPEGMGPDWIILILMMIHGISFFSGLLAKGLERFFVITVMTGSLAGISYHIWSLIFGLIKTNYFWFDIPPYQLTFIKTTFPIYLTLLSLATPFIGTVWFLRSRIPLYQFNPAKWLIGLWVGTYGLTIGATLLFAPPLWPNSNALHGDWHQTGGIVLSASSKTDNPFQKIDNEQAIPCQITLAKLGRKSKVLYQGTNIQKPRFSSAGTHIVFSERNVLKILNLKTHSLISIGPGYSAVWSSDDSQLLCAERSEPRGASRLYLYNVKTGTKILFNEKTPAMTDFTWDSRRKIVYFLGYKNEFYRLNLISQVIKE